MADNARVKEYAKLLESKDYKKRFVGEYLMIRDKADRLDDMLDCYYEDKLGYAPTCPIAVLEAQSNAMWTYLKVLEYRADLELIDLPRD